MSFLDPLRKEKMLYTFIVLFVCQTISQLWILLENTAMHFSFAFKVPPENDGFYFSKLFSMRGCGIVFGTLLNFAIKTFLPFPLVHLSTFYLGCIAMDRLVLILLTHFSNQLAFHAYMTIVFEGMLFGAYFNTFFILLGPYASIAGFAFGVSGFLITVMQMTLDRFLFHLHMLVSRIMLWYCFICFGLSLLLWSFFLYLPYNPSAGDSGGGGGGGSGGGQSDQYSQAVAEAGKFACINFRKYNYRITRKVARKELSFFRHFLNAISPFMILAATNIPKNYIIPALIPFSFLSRLQFHYVFNTISPVYLVGSSFLFAFLKLDPSFEDKWPWYYQLLWILILPQMAVLIICLGIMHTHHPFFESFRGSLWRVNTLNTILFLFFSIIQGASYASLFHHLRNPDFSMDRSAEYVQLLHTLMDRGTDFIISRMTIGYMAFFRGLEFTIREFHPTYNMSFLSSFWFWFKISVLLGYDDFINDFKLNIKDYL